MGKLPRRHFGRVDLLNHQVAAFACRFEINPQTLHPIEEQSELFVKYEQRSLLAASNRSHYEDYCYQRFAGAGGTENQGAGTRVDAPTEQHIEIADPGRMLSSREPSVMFGCYEAWENVDTASGDRKVVVAPTILLATIF